MILAIWVKSRVMVGKSWVLDTRTVFQFILSTLEIQIGREREFRLKYK